MEPCPQEKEWPLGSMIIVAVVFLLLGAAVIEVGMAIGSWQQSIEDAADTDLAVWVRTTYRVDETPDGYLLRMRDTLEDRPSHFREGGR